MMENNFVWDDTNVLEFLRFTQGKERDFKGYYSDIEEFKKSKTVNPIPEYEILSFRGAHQKKIVWNKLPNGKYNYSGLTSLDTEYTLEYMICSLSDGDITINSVKRNDGTIFSVGDKIVVCRKSGYRGNRTIESFKIIDGVLKECDELGDSELSQIYHQPKVPERILLLTTEDGVEIFDNKQNVFVCYPDGSYDFNWTAFQAEILLKVPDIKVFSTEEAAKEYLSMNKPVLSLNDLLSVWGVNSQFGKIEQLKKVYKTAPLFKKFEQLAKDKLKL